MALQGNGDAFPLGQCTYWASYEYHALTGIWVPWSGDAYSWANNAQNAGWVVSSTPPTNQPSIVVLQPGVQGADPSLGHVGVVEGVNPDGSVIMSSMNWHGGSTMLNYQGYPVNEVPIKPGPGVGFAYVPGAASIDMTGGLGGVGAGVTGGGIGTGASGNPVVGGIGGGPLHTSTCQDKCSSYDQYLGGSSAVGGVIPNPAYYMCTSWCTISATLLSWGEHIAVFLLAAILLVLGGILLFRKDVGTKPATEGVPT